MTRVTEHDDAFWDELLEQIDLEVGDLAAAEARLQEAGEAPLTPELAEAMLRDATHVVPVLRLREPRTHRWARVAALLLGTAVLAAAGYWVYSGRYSSRTMSEQAAWALLEGGPEQHRMSALLNVVERVKTGIVSLRGIRDDVTSPQTLRDGARSGLARLLELLVVVPPQQPGAFQADLDSSITRARDHTAAPAVRALEVERLVLAVGSEIGALRTMPDLSSDLARAREFAFRTLRAGLER